MVLVIRRELRRDERGVASTVGTIMALLVFLTFLSLIVNQYVPVWMKDSEASHMDGAVGQFGDLKGAIDFQVLGAIMAQNAGTVFVPSTASTSITLGVDGVPIFSSPTAGQLTSNPSLGTWNVNFTYLITPNAPATQQTVAATSSGQVDLNVANRYYPSGDIAYDDGSVIRSQSDGQVIVAAPTFQALSASGKLSLAFELISLYGSGSASGTSTQIVDTNVFGVNQQTYSNVNSDITIFHVTSYALAWFNFFNTTLTSSLKPASFTFAPSGANTHFIVTAPSVNPIYVLEVNTVLGFVKLTFKSATMPITFTLQQAYVNVGVGSGSNMV